MGVTPTAPPMLPIWLWGVRQLRGGELLAALGHGVVNTDHFAGPVKRPKCPSPIIENEQRGRPWRPLTEAHPSLRRFSPGWRASLGVRCFSVGFLAPGRNP